MSEEIPPGLELTKITGKNANVFKIHNSMKDNLIPIITVNEDGSFNWGDNFDDTVLNFPLNVLWQQEKRIRELESKLENKTID